MDNVALFNELLSLIKLTDSEDYKAATENDNIVELGLDSFDIVMLSVYLGELYDLDNEKTNTIPVGTIKETFEYVERQGEAKFTSIEEAMELVR